MFQLITLANADSDLK